MTDRDIPMRNAAIIVVRGERYAGSYGKDWVFAHYVLEAAGSVLDVTEMSRRSWERLDDGTRTRRIADNWIEDDEQLLGGEYKTVTCPICYCKNMATQTCCFCCYGCFEWAWPWWAEALVNPYDKDVKPTKANATQSTHSNRSNMSESPCFCNSKWGK